MPASTAQGRSDAARKAWATRKANIAKALEPRRCGCCNQPEVIEEVEHHNRYSSRTWTEKVGELKAFVRGLLLCEDCYRGYCDAEYSAIGVAHETRGIKNGHVFGFADGDAGPTCTHHARHVAQRQE